jgi:hypothetical protein
MLTADSINSNKKDTNVHGVEDLHSLYVSRFLINMYL